MGLNIFEYATCKLCGMSYRGEFIVELTGLVRCVDCKNPTTLAEDIRWEETNGEDPERLYTRMFNMLMRDIQVLYPQYEIGGESTVAKFYKNGEINAEKLYFMGNPLELADIAHTSAYDCLAYLDTGMDTYSDFAEKVVGRYMELRERKLSDEEESEFWDWLASEQMTTIKEGMEP